MIRQGKNLKEPGFPDAIRNSLVILVSVIAITVIGGALLPWLFEEGFPGCKIARLLIVAPFFVMPTVSALMWKNLMLHPIYGLTAFPLRAISVGPIDWFGFFQQRCLVVSQHNRLDLKNAFYHSPGLLEPTDIVRNFHERRPTLAE